ncbi:MAG: hypothetical protein E7233_09060 [Lachnospiraceae bacterium]|nr:hypothetical protein [Lachnospiraceae bacterium]
MDKKSILWRAARSLKAKITNIEKADTEKRVAFSQRMVEKRDRKKKKGIKKEKYAFMTQASGLSVDELKEKADHFREMGIVRFSAERFRMYGLYNMDDEQARETLLKMKKAYELERELKWDYRLIDLGKISYEDTYPRMREFMELESSLITMAEKRDIAGKVLYLHPEKMSDEEISDLAIDMEFTRRVLRYGHNGYVQFHLHEKSIPERREFISGRERVLLMPIINSEESKAILDDKLLTYERLHDWFGRDMVSISSEADYFKFKKFFDNNEKAVIKPRFDSLGKGIKLIHKSDLDSLRRTFVELIDEYRHFLMEGFIEAAPEIKALNPDSVNTVRFITHYDGENTEIWSVSMRIGRKGSFVDNAGAGGVTVTVDKDTGTIISDSCDEFGFVYERHPETGIKFKGYQLPAWDKALKVVYSVVDKIEGATFIGWDLACTADHEWVIVEANGKTGFFGAQAPLDKGRRRDFLRVIGAPERGVLCDVVALDMADKVEEQYGIPADEVMEKLVHFESLGLDGRYFEPNKAWELTDEECLKLKDALL